MLPSQLELSVAKKGGFDFFTVTGITFMEIGQRIGFAPDLYVLSKADLSNCEEAVSVD